MDKRYIKINRTATAEQYKEFFDEFFSENDYVCSYDKKGNLKDRYRITKDVAWKQCYSETVKARELFPKYWFVSEDGMLISMWSKPHVVEQNTDKHSSENRRYYKFYYRDEEGEKHIKNIEVHILVAMVFGDRAFGDAEKLIEEKGIFAINQTKEGVNGHHMNDDHTDNRLANNEFVTDETHDLFNIKFEEENENKVVNDMVKIADVITKQVPDKVTVLITGIQEDNRLDREENVESKVVGEPRRLLAREDAAVTLNWINSFLVMLTK